MNESMMVECRMPESAMVREANRHNNVAKPSTIAPKNTLTCHAMKNIFNEIFSIYQDLGLFINGTCKSVVQFSNARPSYV